MNTPEQFSPTSKALMMVLCASILFSAKGIVIKLAYAQGLSTEALMLWRMLVAAPIYVAILYTQRHAVKNAALNRNHIAPLLAISLCGYYLASYLDLAGLQFIDASVERILLYIYPSFVVLINALIFRAAFKRHQIGAMLLAYAGLVLVVSGKSFSLLGIQWEGVLLVIGSALSFAIFVIGSEHFSKKMGADGYTSTAMLIATLAIVLQTGITHGAESELIDIPHNAQSWVLIVGLAIFCTVIPSILMFRGVLELGANKTAIAGMTGPMFTAIFAVLILDETLSIQQLFGMVIVIQAMAWLKNGRISPVSSALKSPKGRKMY